MAAAVLCGAWLGATGCSSTELTDVMDAGADAESDGTAGDDGGPQIDGSSPIDASPMDASAPDAASCAPHEAECASNGRLICVDALKDHDNCGYCGHACATDEACSNGACTLSCGPDETFCKPSTGSPFCANLQNDPNACGSCDNACPHGPNTAAVFCAAGACGATCSGSMLDCNGDLTDGCEVDPTSDPTNCNLCGNVCADGALCHSRACVCSAGFGNPSTAIACGGVCTDTSFDSANCGGCGIACRSGFSGEFSACAESSCHSAYRGAVTSHPVTSVANNGIYDYFVEQGVGIERVVDWTVGETPFLIAADPQAIKVTTDGTSVFWIGTTGVYSCPIDGCTGAPTQLSTLTGSSPFIGVDNTNVYFTFDRSVYACPKTGCAPDVASLYNAQVLQFSVGAGGVLYYTDSFSGLISLTTGATPTRTVLSTNVAYQAPAIYAGGRLYWAGYVGRYAVLGCDPAACAPSTISDTFNFGMIYGLASDGTSVYFTDGSDLRRAPVTGGAYTVIGPIPNGVSQMAVTARDVIWGGGDGLYWAGK